MAWKRPVKGAVAAGGDFSAGQSTYEANAALERAKRLPPGQERVQALKAAGRMRERAIAFHYPSLKRE